MKNNHKEGNKHFWQLECLSAPERLNGNERCDRKAENQTSSWSPYKIDVDDAFIASEFSNSYPMIDTNHKVSSPLLKRFPSSGSDMSADSPVSSMPSLSPIVGTPHITHFSEQNSDSHTPMQQQSLLEQSSYVDNPTSDDDSLQRDPWPHQENNGMHFKVWPEEDFMSRSTRTGWTTSIAATFVQRSQSSHISIEHGRIDGQINENQSVHNQLRFISSTHKCPTLSQLDEIERRDLVNRSAWIDRGDKTIKQERFGHDKVAVASKTSAHKCRNGSQSGDLPSSISLHGQLLYNSPELHRQDNSAMQDGESVYFPMPTLTELQTSLYVKLFYYNIR
ncbi:unnamed protein product [Angiostrongylus costaricensis]|uniref:Protein JASON n=1 Tax=Angiostrongylus costaricensis TaxID=334426 RepID=A0A158PEX5_ANGCS|nr:unnamed protein product [Angiostrongylus costaricensis]